jgi:Flp pilus assembly protein TadD
MMGTTLFQGFAAFVLSGAFAAYGVSPQPAANPATAPGIVSIDLLRHPIAPKVRQLLLRATEKINSGDYETAIGQLQGMLTRYPDSTAYVHDLLGVAYVKTDRFQEAIRSFEQAATLLPHDAMTHYSFGLALICAGDFDRATHEVQRAVELDPKNEKMRQRLNELLAKTRAGN